MVKKFAQSLTTAPEITPRLPLTHTTGSLLFQKIIENQLIELHESNTFHEPLAFFFYGRPAYRPKEPHAGFMGSTKPFLPCCLLLKNETVELKRIFPFDTGAFETGRMVSLVPQGILKEDFQLDPSMEIPPRLVGKFYGSNHSYYSGCPQLIHIPPLSFEIQCYYDIISHKATTGFDDRGSAIEIQSDKTLSLTKNNVCFIVLPSIFMEEDIIKNTIVKNWNISPGHYSAYNIPPDAWVGKIYELVEQFLSEKEFFK